MPDIVPDIFHRVPDENSIAGLCRKSPVLIGLTRNMDSKKCRYFPLIMVIPLEFSPIFSLFQILVEWKLCWYNPLYNCSS